MILEVIWLTPEQRQQRHLEEEMRADRALKATAALQDKVNKANRARAIWRASAEHRKIEQRKRFEKAHHDRYELVCGLRRAGATLQQIADLAGLTRERIRQMECKGKRQADQRWRMRSVWGVRGRIDAGIDNDRDRWHVWVPETQYRELDGRG